jgi:hypothetical protein
MSPSTFDILLALAYSMTVLMVALGVMGLLLAARRDVSNDLIRTLTWLYILWVAGFTCVGYYYRVPPPLISGIAIEVALIAAALTAGKGNDAAMSASA